jgi:hypothetical protein
MLALYTMKYLDHTLENIPLARACYGQKTQIYLAIPDGPIGASPYRITAHHTTNSEPENSG